MQNNDIAHTASYKVSPLGNNVYSMGNICSPTASLLAPLMILILNSNGRGTRGCIPTIVTILDPVRCQTDLHKASPTNPRFL
jgi:hypothetical protein